MNTPSINKAKERLSKYSSLFLACSTEGLAYAACVSSKSEVKLNRCLIEFDAFKKCLSQTAEKLGTRI